MASSLKCPNCRRPLSTDIEIKEGRKTVWNYCSFGPCEAYILNDGGCGPTLDAAHQSLLQMYQEWLEGE